MKNRIFMLVPQVFHIADKLGVYSDDQTHMIDKYYETSMKMVDDMEGKSKLSLETAATHIKLETYDAIGRMTGFNIVYKLTGNNRLLLDDEGAESAQEEALGAGRKGKIRTGMTGAMTAATAGAVAGATAAAVVSGAAESVREVAEEYIRTTDEIVREYKAEAAMPEIGIGIPFESEGVVRAEELSTSNVIVGDAMEAVTASAEAYESVSASVEAAAGGVISEAVMAEAVPGQTFGGSVALAGSAMASEAGVEAVAAGVAAEAAGVAAGV